MTHPSQIPFQRNAVQPVECIKGGWNLINNQYWLIFAMWLVGWMIASAVPLGILMGPMMCGLFLTFFKLRRGQPIEFGTLFKGFDYFGQSVLATLLHVVPILAIVIPSYILFYVFFLVAVMAGGGEEPNGLAMLGVILILALFWIVVIGAIMVVSIGFTFVYPLIVDRGVQGLDAVKLSFRAAMANFSRLFGLVVISFFLNLAGLLLCVVGLYLVLPIGYAAIAVAYEQVFGLAEGGDAGSDGPPPPPVFT
ncbi:MAG TPA: hypothetical protein VJT15_10695 [Pyrinomonadaceae bacterium]|nr:hypothetical protein [Pyrinomonadaceae bacterium]